MLGRSSRVNKFLISHSFDFMKFSFADMIAMLPMPPNEKWPDGVWDIEPLKKGNATLVFFAPRGTDHQTFHEDDEFYVIVRGSGEILLDGERSAVQTGDALFVEAGKPHRFENFTDDFATWAVFIS